MPCQGRLPRPGTATVSDPARITQSPPPPPRPLLFFPVAAPAHQPRLKPTRMIIPSGWLKGTPHRWSEGQTKPASSAVASSTSSTGGTPFEQIGPCQGLDGALDLLADPLAGDFQVVLRLQVPPELRTRSEVPRQPQCHLRRNRPVAVALFFGR